MILADFGFQFQTDIENFTAKHWWFIASSADRYKFNAFVYCSKCKYAKHSDAMQCKSLDPVQAYDQFKSENPFNCKWMRFVDPTWSTSLFNYMWNGMILTLFHYYDALFDSSFVHPIKSSQKHMLRGKYLTIIKAI